jgi:hypothetical protein
MPDLHESIVAPEDITWDFNNATSDYAELRERALREFEGNSYLTTYARKSAFSHVADDPASFTGTAQYQAGEDFGATYDTLAALYFGQSRANAGLEGRANCESVLRALDSEDLVVEEGAPDGSLTSRAFECEEHTDLAAAMIGMHPSDVWITRLEMRLPREALSMDCTIEPGGEQATVNNRYRATKAKNRPAGCEEPIFASRIARGSGSTGSAFVVAAAAVLGLRIARRLHLRRTRRRH